MDTEKSIRNSIISDYKTSSEFDDKFIKAFFDCLQSKTNDLMSSSFTKSNSKKYLLEYVNFFSHAWLTRNINTFKRGYKVINEISNKMTGCNISNTHV
jgi:type IV secretory pathway VirB6-like protein